MTLTGWSTTARTFVCVPGAKPPLEPAMFVPRLIARLTTWPVESQHTARHNALIASTALTQLRVERDQVTRYVEAAAARHHARVAQTAQPA